MTIVEFASSINNATTALRPIAMQLTRNHEDTQDLLQVTLMKAWANRERFNPGTNLKAWLYTIMKNTFLSEYQRKRRQQTYVDITDNNYYINSSNAANSDYADSGIRMDEINASIDALPESNRAPFQMFLDGYKYEEISVTLGIPLGTVKNRIFLARQELKTVLSKSGFRAIS